MSPVDTLWKVHDLYKIKNSKGLSIHIRSLLNATKRLSKVSRGLDGTKTTNSQRTKENSASEDDQDFAELDQVEEVVEGIMRLGESRRRISFEGGAGLEEGYNFKERLGGMNIAKE